MTATTAPRPSAPAPEPTPRAAPTDDLVSPTGPTGPSARPGAGATIAAEVLLAATTLIAVLGFLRLFREAAAIGPLLAAAATAHVVAVAARRRGLRLGGTLLATLAAFVVQVSVVLYPGPSAFGLPTGSTLDAVGRDLDRAWSLFGEVTAPAPRARGFLLAATVAIWAAASLADWAAFRVRAIAEAVLPAVALFTFSAILGEGRGGVALAAGLAAAAFGFALAQRVWHDARTPWVGTARRGRRAQVGLGVLMAGAAVAVSAGVVPHLPGTQQDALLDWRADGPGNRLTVSPLVDIRSRLVQQSDTVVFTVEADQAAYWRLTSLDSFDGTVWSSSESFSRADGRLPGVPPDAATRRVDQRFKIETLGSIWAPAALTPVEVARSSTPLRWNGELATLIVPVAVESIDEATYLVTSEVPSFTEDDLRQRLPERLPDDLAAATDLPSGIRPLVRDLAAEAVEGRGTSPYERAESPAGLVPDQLRVRHLRGRLRARPGRHGRLPPGPTGVLRAVRRHLRGHGPQPRHPGPGRGRLHPG